MIDVHSHIVPTVDDGAQNIDVSIAMIKNAKNIGIDEIFLTSHYMEDGYHTSTEEYESIIQVLKNRISEEKLEVNLYVGNEVMVFPDLIKHLNEKKFFTLNNSRYVLIELPLMEEVLYVWNVLFQLKEKGYVPVIAHPERYRCVQENVEYAKKLIEAGALLQSNVGSILGMYGSQAKNTLKKLLKDKLVDLLGSDSHSPHRVYDVYLQALNKIKKICNEEYVNTLTTDNPKRIINDETIEKEYSSQSNVRRRWLWIK